MIELAQGSVGVEMRFAVTTVDDEGALVPLDLTDCSAAVLRLERPDHSTVDLPATVLDPATSGLVSLTSDSSTLAQHGQYRAQPRLTFPGGVLAASIVAFKVHPSLPAPPDP